MEIVYIHLCFGSITLGFVLTTIGTAVCIPYNRSTDSLGAALLTCPSRHETDGLHYFGRVVVVHCGFVPKVPHYNAFVIAEAAHHLLYKSFKSQRVGCGSGNVGKCEHW